MKRLIHKDVLVQAQDEWCVVDRVASEPVAKWSFLREAMPIDADSDYERRLLFANEQSHSLHAAGRRPTPTTMRTA